METASPHQFFLRKYIETASEAGRLRSGCEAYAKKWRPFVTLGQGGYRILSEVPSRKLTRKMSAVSLRSLGHFSLPAMFISVEAPLTCLSLFPSTACALAVLQESIRNEGS